ncbi:uncharacterized protein ACLA_035370 [Aspergillus clavatus NRRL 1]|uniref:Uncharacterized protein n=1 Tax=Aspergillus clavatus (strain ATCC 1007 / CBS 513.65 / DSM 816 / NCTC 3887 / NRRL 1 / QM 1276 / 107) TaxID=344612 RepID=A1CJL0_ASPCL|nr:uncharacterized protein ACLA_035370 [Aspergillus clavatus NRRL 1]EAW09334.1 conserved hypothetical protein [Aspergillus clavatus NRRL 1]
MEGECECGYYDKNFPGGSVLRKLQGTTWDVGDHAVLLQEIVLEHYDYGFAQRKAMFEAELVGEKKPVFVTIWVQSDPFQKGPDPRNELKHRALELFQYECDVWEALSGSGHTPDFFGAAELVQDSTFEYPGGYLHLIAQGRYPFVGLEEAYEWLYESNLPFIEKQLRDMVVYATDIDVFEETEVYDDPLKDNQRAVIRIDKVMEEVRRRVVETHGPITVEPEDAEFFDYDWKPTGC